MRERSNTGLGILAAVVAGLVLFTTATMWEQSRRPGTIAQVSRVTQESVSAQTEPGAPQAPQSTSPSAQATALLAERGESGVQIVWSDDPSVNCGLQLGPEGGCFHADQPDVIFVSPGLSGPTLTYVVLHELAHVHQLRAGAPLDECAADAQAIAWGADPSLAHYRCPG